MDSGPDVAGWQAFVTLAAFAVVILVVPWLLVRDAARARRATDVGSPDAFDPGDTGDVPTTEENRGVFASEREKRLWLWTVAVVAAIYLTLSPAQTIAAALRERGLLGPTTWAVLLVVAAVIAVRWARTRPGVMEVGAGLGVAAVYITTLIRLPVPEARSHLFEYSLVGMLVYQALLERNDRGGRVPAPSLVAIVVTSLLGWADEGIQAVLPNRVYDLRDVAFNAIAATMAVGATVLIRWARARWTTRRTSPEGRGE